MANKSPAFQFYPADYLTDYRTVSLSLEQHGAYIILLSYDWLNDGIPNDIGSVKGLLRVPLTHDVGIDLGPVLSLFVDHPTCAGLVTNPRLQEEREKQKAFREQAREAGKKGGRRSFGNNKDGEKRNFEASDERKGEAERVRLGSAKGTPSFQSQSQSQSLINTSNEVLSKKTKQAPLLPNCEFFRATTEQLETAKATWIKNGNSESDFQLAISEVEFWLGTESTQAKKARKAETHVRQLHAAWVAENVARRHKAHNRTATGKMRPLTAHEQRMAELKQEFIKAGQDEQNSFAIEGGE